MTDIFHLIKRRKYSFDFSEDYIFDKEQEYKLKMFKFHRAARIIYNGMYKFWIKLRARKQVQLRYFSKHHRDSIDLIERNFIKYLRRKHKIPVDHLRYLYQKLFLQKLKEDLSELNAHLVHERAQEMHLQEAMKIKERELREAKERERQEREEKLLEEEHEMILERQSFKPKEIIPKDNFPSTENDDPNENSSFNRENQQWFEENKQGFQNDENEIVDDEMFGHMKNSNSNSPSKYQSMYVKKTKVIELYNDSRKSTYIFKEEDESIKIPKNRGVTQKVINPKFSALGEKGLLDENDVIPEEDSYMDDSNLTDSNRASFDIHAGTVDQNYQMEGMKNYESYDMNVESENSS